MLPIAIDIVARHDLCQAHFVKELYITIANRELPDNTTVSVRVARNLYELLVCARYFQVVATCCYFFSHLKRCFVSTSEQRLRSSVRIVLSFRLCLLDVLCLLARPSVCAGAHCARACVAPAAVSFLFTWTRWLHKTSVF